VVEFVAAGAADVALGTILFGDPAAPGRIRSEVEQELVALGVDDADNILGRAHGAERLPEPVAAADTSLPE
jgi:dihydroorotate dehydrogenase (NAD+) catalytic subunit